MQLLYCSIRWYNLRKPQLKFYVRGASLAKAETEFMAVIHTALVNEFRVDAGLQLMQWSYPEIYEYWNMFKN